MSKEEFLLYIHVPFCASRCGYCGFYSVVPQSGMMERYSGCVINEAAYRIPDSGASCFKTVYMGGGTPTFLPVPALARLLSFVSSELIGPSTEEFSLEANPSSLDWERAKLLAAAGVNRVTLGLQSGQEDVRYAVHRSGDAGQLGGAITMLQNAGIRNIGVDLIVGLPGQTPDGLERDIARLVGGGVKHISAYFLSLESGTMLERAVLEGNCNLPSQSRTRRMFQHLSWLLQKSGFVRYEVSNFALPGYEAKHNSLTWAGAEYIGLGAAASGCYGGVRYRNIEDVHAYLKMSPEEVVGSAERDPLSPESCFQEAVMLGLRCSAGVDCRELYSKFHRDLYSEGGERIDRFLERGLLRMARGRLYCTRKGWYWLDDILVSLLRD